MNVATIIQECQSRGVQFRVADGELQVRGTIRASDRIRIQENKAAILECLTPHPKGLSFREDERGRLIFSDGLIYSPTDTGGWILTHHPKRRMICPGTFEPDNAQVRP